jgi:hypothetical protein
MLQAINFDSTIGISNFYKMRGSLSAKGQSSFFPREATNALETLLCAAAPARDFLEL